MTKESCNRIGLRFQSGERFFDRQSKVKLVGDRVFGDISLDVLPDLLVGVELRRVRRQVDAFEAALDGLDVGLDGLGLVDAVAIHDQDDGLLGLQHELLQETLEHLSVDQPFMGHELHGAVQADGRDHLDRGPRAGAAHDGRLSDGPPGSAAMSAADVPLRYIFTARIRNHSWSLRLVGKTGLVSNSVLILAFYWN